MGENIPYGSLSLNGTDENTSMNAVILKWSYPPNLKSPSGMPLLGKQLYFSDVTYFSAYFNDIVVGAVCCRVDTTETSPKSRRLYIMTLGCLAPYRRLGIGEIYISCNRLTDFLLNEIKHKFLFSILQKSIIFKI